MPNYKENCPCVWCQEQRAKSARDAGVVATLKPMKMLDAKSASASDGSYKPGRYIDRLDSASRKQYPMATGFLDYFPDAAAAVSHVSWLGNEKHNQGQPLHWARGKSSDQADCLMRHHSARHSVDPGYPNDALAKVLHLAEAAWRAMAQLQIAMEETYALERAPGAKE